MMMNDMKKNELNEQEVEQVTGGDDTLLHIMRTYEQMQKLEEAKKKNEEARQRARQQEEARRQAEAASQATIHIHGGGVSGSW